MTEKEEEVSIIILLQHEGRGPQHAMCTSTLHSIIQNIIIHTIIKHDDSAADQSQPKLSNWLIKDRAFHCPLHLSIRRGKNNFVTSFGL